MAEPETASEQTPETMPLEDLQSLIESGGEPPPEQEAEPEAAAAPEESTEQEQAEEAEPVSEPPPPDPEQIAKTLRDERQELLVQQYEDLRKKYGELQKHSSRLASKLGRSRHEQVEEMPDEPVVPDVLEERLSRLEERQNKEAVRVAISDEFHRFDTKPEIQALNLEVELKQVASRHTDRVRALTESTDPEEARLAAREIALSVLTEAISERMKASTARSTEEAVTAPARIAARKTSAALSNTGGKRASVRVQAQNPSTMPLDDLKRLIDSTRPE